MIKFQSKLVKMHTVRIVLHFIDSRIRVIDASTGTIRRFLMARSIYFPDRSVVKLRFMVGILGLVRNFRSVLAQNLQVRIFRSRFSWFGPRYGFFSLVFCKTLEKLCSVCYRTIIRNWPSYLFIVGT